VEYPVTFRPRWGESKGGNVNNRRALTVGLRMMIGITTDWRLSKRRAFIMRCVFRMIRLARCCGALCGGIISANSFDLRIAFSILAADTARLLILWWPASV
jgi:hypothetical protein